MTPFYLTQIANPVIEGDQDQSQLPQVHVRDKDYQSQQQLLLQTKPIDLLLIGGPSDCPVSFPTYNNNDNKIKKSSCAPFVRGEDHQGSGKWMSSKMRIMRKMKNTDQIAISKPRTNSQVPEDQRQQNNESSSSGNSNNIQGGGIIRVCSDCNTTKTPLWRSGPRGPKSLCNACGIRQRKAKRAMAAAAINGGLIPTQTPCKVQKEMRSDVDLTVPFKKRFKITTSGTAQKKLRFEDITLSMSKNSASHRAFQQDERDAAILLMALSCGLIHS